MIGDLGAAESTLEYLVNNNKESEAIDRWIGRRAALYLERRWF